MKISRSWAMPSHETFSIKPIKELLDRYLKYKNTISIDPFARNSKRASITNDFDSNTSAEHHLNALDFIEKFGRSADICLFDPPYTLRQCKEHYEKAGFQFKKLESQNCIRWTLERNALAERQGLGAIVISFGYTTTCMGKKRGYEILEILMVSHGAAHNDTLVTVERKIK